MSKKTDRLVWLRCPSSLFCEDCDACDALSSPNLMTMHAKLRYHVVTQGMRTSKIFSEYKKCYC